MENFFLNFLNENTEGLVNVVENIINNQDDIIDYVQKNVDLEEVGKFVDSVISSKEEMEN